MNAVAHRDIVSPIQNQSSDAVTKLNGEPSAQVELMECQLPLSKLIELERSAALAAAADRIAGWLGEAFGFDGPVDIETARAVVRGEA